MAKRPALAVPPAPALAPKRPRHREASPPTSDVVAPAPGRHRAGEAHERPAAGRPGRVARAKPPAAAAARPGAAGAPPLPAESEPPTGRGEAAAVEQLPGPLHDPPAPAATPPRSGAPLWTRRSASTSGVAGLVSFSSGGIAAGALILPADGSHGHALDAKLAAAAEGEGSMCVWPQILLSKASVAHSPPTSNALPGYAPFVVLRTTPDGNCLAHACRCVFRKHSPLLSTFLTPSSSAVSRSLGVWGVPDSDALLRQAIAATMASPGAGASVRARFAHALTKMGIPAEEVCREWDAEQRVFQGPLRGGRGPPTLSRGFLSDVHCFVLANVLGRPLIVYGNSVALAAGLAGVYLPLLRGVAPGALPSVGCPTSLLFHRSHFSVLATLSGAAGGAAPPQPPAPPAAPPPSPPPLLRLPLAVRGADGAALLPLRFLLPEEEGSAQELLDTWLPHVSTDPATGLPAYCLTPPAVATPKASLS